MNEGRLVSGHGLDIAMDEFLDHFEEYQVPYSNALQCRHKGSGAYFVGPLARWNLNADHAPPSIRDLARETGIAWPCRNPYVSIVVRASRRSTRSRRRSGSSRRTSRRSDPFVAWEPRAGSGEWITEAPRGILYHRYEADASGLITAATIIPPTSQNQRQIEEDLIRFAPTVLGLAEDQAAWRCEQVVRNYDPCISCATHALKLKVTEVMSLIVGLGSPHGDDRAGWDAVDRLRERLPAGIGIAAHKVRGAIELLECLEGQDLAIVIDAAEPAGHPGTIRSFEWPAPDLASYARMSTHGLGLAEALGLAGSLGLLPPRVVIYTIEARDLTPGAADRR